jgi:hypothetical protein
MPENPSQVCGHVKRIVARNRRNVSEREQLSSVGGSARRLTERMPFIKRLIAKTIDFDGAYHRFTGKVMIEKFEREVRVEVFDNQAIWELMYFGRALASAIVKES